MSRFAAAIAAALKSRRTVAAFLPLVAEYTLDAERLARRLTPAERDRAARFHFAKDRTLYVAAHWLFARVIDAALGGAQQWRLSESIDGSKPRLEMDGTATLFANLSHTSGMVLVGVSETAEIGADVEAVRPVRDLGLLAASTMTPRERAAIAAAPAPEPLFIRLWARKEALLKAHGIGIGAPLTAIDVLDANAIRPGSLPRASRTLVDLELGEAVMGSVCLLAERGEVVTIPLRVEDVRSTGAQD